MYGLIHGDYRITIVCGKYEGEGKRCADYIYTELSHLVPYVLTITEADKLTDEEEKYYNIIAVGTTDNNSFIKRLRDNGHLTIPDCTEGYRIKIFDNPKNNERQIFALAGGGHSGALYAISEFCLNFIPAKSHIDVSEHYFKDFFAQKAPETDFEDRPRIKERGIWTWGHTIFDYKRFIDNMVRLKMNMLIIWNDHVPINAKEMVEYAHISGIKIIWGISFGWGYEYDISMEEKLKKIVNDSLDNYEKNYAHLGGDGLYFQTFTETKDDSKNGVSIAAQATMFVNLARKIATDRFGDIRLQFGLHATSVKNNLSELKNVRNDVEIVWEDCGAFPFAYLAHLIDGFDETCDFVKKISGLRGNDDRFSVVLKGLCCLDWTKFEHQQGNFILGMSKDTYCSQRFNQKKRFWRNENAYWIRNADKAVEMMRVIKNAKNGNTMVTALIEDGLFEEKINYGAAVMGLSMWNCDMDTKDIMCEAAMLPGVDF